MALRREIDDGQPSEPERGADFRVGPDADIVRTTVLQRIGH
jgi:hypothetical protein